MCKLVIAASSYYIWQERNNRLFTSTECTAKQVTEKIKNIVRLRLMDFEYRGDVDYRRTLQSGRSYVGHRMKTQAKEDA
ncbi:hypothetical protein HanPSC8_Chr17g0780741 [Helianthus annuus]|nr:hypothetical protein HanPSC8_Chr17g0780741 [Helianthus annuus]